LGARRRIRFDFAMVMIIVGAVMMPGPIWIPVLFRWNPGDSIEVLGFLILGSLFGGAGCVAAGLLMRQARHAANIKSILRVLGLRRIEDSASRITAAQRLARTSFLPVIPSDRYGNLFDPFRWFAVGDVAGIDVALLEHMGRLAVATALPANFPLLSVRREDVLDKVARAMGLEDIDTEWEEFNAAFRIKSEDRKFALMFLDATVMRWLYGMREHIEALDVRGPVMLLHWEVRKSLITLGDVRRRVEMLAALSGLVPGVVLQRYCAPKVAVGNYLCGLEPRP